MTHVQIPMNKVFGILEIEDFLVIGVWKLGF